MFSEDDGDDDDNGGDDNVDDVDDYLVSTVWCSAP